MRIEFIVDGDVACNAARAYERLAADETGARGAAGGINRGRVQRAARPAQLRPQLPAGGVNAHFSRGSGVIVEFATRQTPGWSEKHGRSDGFREVQAWRRDRPGRTTGYEPEVTSGNDHYSSRSIRYEKGPVGLVNNAGQGY